MTNRTKKVVAIFIVCMILTSSAVYANMEFEAEKVYNSIFVIYSGSALGSGFAIGENCIITNAHVIESQKNIKIATYDGKRYSAFIIAKDDKLDIAVLGVEGVKFTPLKVATSEIAVGNDVYAIRCTKQFSVYFNKRSYISKRT